MGTVSQSWAAKQRFRRSTMNQFYGDLVNFSNIVQYVLTNTLLTGGVGVGIVDGYEIATTTTGLAGGTYLSIANRTQTLSPSTQYYVYLVFTGWTGAVAQPTPTGLIQAYNTQQSGDNYLHLFDVLTSTAGAVATISNQAGVQAPTFMPLAGGTMNGTMFTQNLLANIDATSYTVGDATHRYLGGYFMNAYLSTAGYMGGTIWLNVTRDATFNSLAIDATGFGFSNTGAVAALSAAFGSSGQATIDALGAGAFAAGTTIGGGVPVTEGGTPNFVGINLGTAGSHVTLVSELTPGTPAAGAVLSNLYSLGFVNGNSHLEVAGHKVLLQVKRFAFNIASGETDNYLFVMDEAAYTNMIVIPIVQFANGTGAGFDTPDPATLSQPIPHDLTAVDAGNGNKMSFNISINNGSGGALNGNYLQAVVISWP